MEEIVTNWLDVWTAELKCGMYFARLLECGSRAAALLSNGHKPAKRGPFRQNERFFSQRAMKKAAAWLPHSKRLATLDERIQNHRTLQPHKWITFQLNLACHLFLAWRLFMRLSPNN
ncbi:MAG: hypothetical protein N3D11_04870 [Candidatus Sumerlaeia bacterium]|nr:hypothetical protein [Candidatus Sumerlaeia bacterium]